MGLEEIEHPYGWNGKQRHKMHSKGESHYKGYEQQPLISSWGIKVICPFKPQPEHGRHEKHRHSVHLRFGSIEPKAIGEGISQSAHYPTAIQSNYLSIGKALLLCKSNLFGEIDNDKI